MEHGPITIQYLFNMPTLEYISTFWLDGQKADEHINALSKKGYKLKNEYIGHTLTIKFSLFEGVTKVDYTKLQTQIFIKQDENNRPLTEKENEEINAHFGGDDLFFSRPYFLTDELFNDYKIGQYLDKINFLVYYMWKSAGSFGNCESVKIKNFAPRDSIQLLYDETKEISDIKNIESVVKHNLTEQPVFELMTGKPYFKIGHLEVRPQVFEGFDSLTFKSKKLDDYLHQFILLPLARPPFSFDK